MFEQLGFRLLNVEQKCCEFSLSEGWMKNVRWHQNYRPEEGGRASSRPFWFFGLNGFLRIYDFRWITMLVSTSICNKMYSYSYRKQNNSIDFNRFIKDFPPSLDFCLNSPRSKIEPENDSVVVVVIGMAIFQLLKYAHSIHIKLAHCKFISGNCCWS